MNHLERLAACLATSVLCAILDGMDQSKFRCPKLTRRPSKNVEALYRPTLHCSGVWQHGFRFSFHVSNEDVKKDSTTQLELLFLNISSLLDTHSKLPLVLHIQQDNCFREGKNQYVCAAMILLVILKVFRATCLGYLRSGHSRLELGLFIILFYSSSFTLSFGRGNDLDKLGHTYCYCSNTGSVRP